MMKRVWALVACGWVAAACGCGMLQVPAGTGTDVTPPPDTEGEVALVEAESTRVPIPLSLEASAPALSYDIRRSLRRPPRVAGHLDAPLKRRWRYIVIHHSDTQQGSEASFDRYHREHNGWRGVGYDFVIGNGNGSPDGLVEVTFRWEMQQDGAHAGHPTYNKHGIGICLVGDFDRGYPTARQMEALVGLVNYLQERCHIPTQNIMGHMHVRPGGTHCPGRNFPWFELFSRLNH
jgi:hypothetical protein